MSDPVEKRPSGTVSGWTVPSVTLPTRLLPETTANGLQKTASRQPYATGSLKLDFQSAGSRSPDMWAVSAIDPRSGLGITIPGGPDRGMTAGSFNIGGQASWFSGLYRTTDVGGGIQMGVIGGRMMDMVPNPVTGIAKRENDRFMGGVMLSYTDEKTGQGVEVKCLDSPKDNKPVVCAASYKFRLDKF